MPSLILEPTYTSAQVLYAQWSDHAPPTKRPSHSAHIHWACRLHLHARVHISGGGELDQHGHKVDKNAIPGSITVLPAIEAKSENATGFLSLYSREEPRLSAFEATLFAERDLFTRIARHADARFLPTVSLTLKEDAGITHGPTLDLEWDTAHHPEVEVLAFELWWRTLSHDPLLEPPRPDPLGQISTFINWIQTKGAWVLLAVLGALGVARWLSK